MNPSEAHPIFSKADLSQIRQSGRDIEDIQRQLARFVEGFPPLTLIRPIKSQDGLFNLQGQEGADAFIQLFEQKSPHHKVCKFVPASGAASRMFKTLYAFISTPDQLDDTQKKEVEYVCGNLPKFAFYPELKRSLMAEGHDLAALIREKAYEFILTKLLTKEGLNFGQMPKALLPFHSYEGFVRTALEEHLVEAAQYCKSAENQVSVHFTVSEQHQALVQGFLTETVPAYEQAFQCTFHLDTSIQHASTDTLAVGIENQPFRDANGQLVFRPGGHGALLENLNGIDADWVFIKNIDNVVTDTWKAETYLWKKLIGGALILFQNEVFYWLDHLDEEGLTSEEELLTFMQETLSIGFPAGFTDWNSEKRLAYIRRKLNRPIRVCGVIQTDENTGGGPFWVKNRDGSMSVQIVETAQVDFSDPQQKAIAKQSHYANITDLVCGLKDYQRNKFDLLEFRDDQTGFITQKSLNGQPLKALEHPGLWNGCMADWITLLVEVPTATFNPVKSVTDLLEPMH